VSDAEVSHGEPALVTKLKASKERHRERHVLYRAAFVVAGVICLLTGAAMLLLPGPAFVVIPIGLALLALEFAWAERLLDHSLRQADKARRRAGRTTTTERVLSGLLVAACVAAFAVAALSYDIPVLPV
jgi:uncharacterized protein (TIGR02611 family)